MNAIGWCDETWNPMTGCTPVSEACEHCYAERMARRFPQYPCQVDGDCPHETNEYNQPDCETICQHFTPIFHPHRLDKPLHWRKPRRIFVCSMSDLFHEAFTWEQRWDVLDVVERCPQHTFIVLTKRAKEMHDFFAANEDRQNWPPANLWLGVTVENQARADKRIPILLDTPAAVRFACCEPLLGPVDLDATWAGTVHTSDFVNQLDWVIVGGENGPGARPMQPEWALDLRRQCKAAGVPFWWKGWGAKIPWQEAGWPFVGECVKMCATRELPAVPP